MSDENTAWWNVENRDKPADVEVRVMPGHFFTRAFHEGCGGPMANLTRHMKSLEAENGDQLHLWECCACGALVLAGIARDRRIVHHQLSRRVPSTDSSAALSREKAAAVEAVLAIIESEPELEGEPPPGVLMEVQRDPTRVLRSAVRATKASIARRVRAALEGGAK